MDNVNNLNGISNFGHGGEEVAQAPQEVIPTEEETPSIDEEDIEVETEVTDKKHGKRKSK